MARFLTSIFWVGGMVLLLVFWPVIDYAGTPELIGALYPDSTYVNFGTRILGVGDQNGDGYGDVLISRLPREMGLFFGGLEADTAGAVWFDTTTHQSSNIGDANGDSYDDYVLVDWTVPVRLDLHYGGPPIDTIPDLWFGLDTMAGVGYCVRGDDIDRTGNDEVIAIPPDGNTVVFYELGSDADSIPDLTFWPFKMTPPQFQLGRDLMVGDFSGDGVRDLAVAVLVAYHKDVRGSVSFFWGGDVFDTLPDLIIHRPGPYIEGSDRFGVVLENLGDINSDGYEDFLVSAGMAVDDTLAFIYFGGPGIDTIPDVTITKAHSTFRAAGDVNNDGYADLIAGYPTPVSWYGYVDIYLGGPGVDSIADVTFNVDPDGYPHTYFGRDVAGIGDYNGDGIDDFAFSSSMGIGESVVYVYAGWDDSATDVPYEYEANLPSEITLRQNYPNPFNSSTQIEFFLRERSNVTLEIFNVLGRKARTLIDGELLPNGRHAVSWDGRLVDGQVAASGVYLYRLSTGDGREIKKMLLLK